MHNPWLSTFVMRLVHQKTASKPSQSNHCDGTEFDACDPASYTNPIWPRNFPDPTIIKGDDGYFYIYATESDGQHIPILRSTDLVDWIFAGSVFNTKPEWGTPGADLWAPDIVKIGKTYVLYYALSIWDDPNPGIGVATAAHPLGPWSDLGKLFDSKSIGVNNSIDPVVFTDKDKVAMIWGSMRGMYGVELTPDGIALKDGAQAKNTKVHIAGFDTSTPWHAATYEAPFVVKKDGYFYLFVSSGLCCEGLSSTYHVRVSRAKQLLGPYLDHNNQSMLGGNRGFVVLESSEYFVGPGHNTVIQDEAGDYWIIYHSYSQKTPTQRILLMDKLVWTEAGWPMVENKKPSHRPIAKPFFATTKKP